MTRWLRLLLLLALALRLGYALAQPGYDVIRYSGGDSPWYLANGAAFFSGAVSGTIDGINYDLSRLPNAPLYFLFIGFWQHLLPIDAAIIVIRMVQSLLGTAICWMAYRMACRLSDDQRVGLVACAALALHPGLIIDAANILTESLYLFWVCAGIWLYVETLIPRANKQASWRMGALVGVLLGLGTLTRATLLLFPLGLVGHALLLWRGRGLRAGLSLLLAYTLVVCTWTAYNLTQYNRFVIASDQLTAAFWRGAVTTDGSPEENDAQLADSSYEEQAIAAVSSDLLGYVQLRISELLAANLQPYNTIPLGHESLRAQVMHWLQDDFSVAGVGRLISSDGFWPKLLLYLFHYIGLIAGLIGVLLTRTSWRVSTVYLGFIAYTLLLHLILLALPRYIFPTQVFWWLFAAHTLIYLWDQRPRRFASANNMAKPPRRHQRQAKADR